MIQANAPAAPRVHEAAIAIARRVTDMLAGILRDDERGEAERESYIIAREVIESMPKGDI